MERQREWGQRRDELLAKLEARAASCPGLYPLRAAEDFLRVAQDHAGPGTEEVCRILEIMWQRPDEAVQFNAQSLIRRGGGFKKAESENRNSGEILPQRRRDR